MDLITRPIAVNGILFGLTHGSYYEYRPVIVIVVIFNALVGPFSTSVELVLRSDLEFPRSVEVQVSIVVS